MFKKSIYLAGIAVAFSVSPVSAKNIDDINIGDIVCYDRLGPWDTIGEVVSKRGSKVELRLSNGKVKSYKAKKIKGPTYCRLKQEAFDWAVKKGVNAILEN